jgi:hypothetical protein
MGSMKVWIVVDGIEKPFDTPFDAAREIYRQRKLAVPGECKVMPPEAEAEVMGELMVIEMIEGS